MAKSQVISEGGSQPETFLLEEHKQYGRRLKQIYCELEALSAMVGASYPRTSSKDQGELKKVLDAIQKFQYSMYLRVSTDFSALPDTEVLPIYLGRLEIDNGGSYGR